MREIAMLVFDGVEELDAVGPWEVLAHWATTYPQDEVRVRFASRDGEPVLATKGMTLVPHLAIGDLPPLEVLVHPGGRGTRALQTDEAHLEWLRGLARTSTLMTSVCTGSIVFGAAGLLARRPAATYWDSFDELVATDASITPRPDDRFVDDGDIVTSAGVSAGIDMALHLVHRLAGRVRAREVRRGIQYDPQPPI